MSELPFQLIEETPTFDNENERMAGFLVSLAKAEKTMPTTGKLKEAYEDQLGYLKDAIEILYDPSCPKELVLEYKKKPGGLQKFASLLAKYKDWNEKQGILAKAIEKSTKIKKEMKATPFKPSLSASTTELKET
jgi:hypothetical protein